MSNVKVMIEDEVYTELKSMASRYPCTLSQLCILYNETRAHVKKEERLTLIELLAQLLAEGYSFESMINSIHCVLRVSNSINGVIIPMTTPDFTCEIEVEDPVRLIRES